MKFFCLLSFMIFMISPQKYLIENYIKSDLQKLILKRNALAKISKNGLTYLITAYSPTVEECDKNPFITADGSKVRFGIVAGCPKKFPFGSKIYINGLGIFYVHDRGGAIKNNRIDVFYFSTSYAKLFGVQKRKVILLE